MKSKSQLRKDAGQACTELKKAWNGLLSFLIMIISGMILSLVFVSVCVHAAEAGVLDAAVYDGDIYIYIRGITQIEEGTSVQIGNIACSPDQITAVSFRDMETAVRTLVLVDNSKSISGTGQEDIGKILEGLVAASMDNEQIKVGTFSDTVTYLCDYTGDKDILNNVVNGISYYDQDSFLSDILYDEIAALKEKGAGFCTRILVFSDGADDNAIGYTNDEVRSYIGENAYQIYTVGIPGKNNSKELEEMFSFSRAAKSNYFLMDGNITAEDVVNTLLQDQEGVCLKITPDEILKDGSRKSILLQLNTAEGNVQLTASVNMPFGTGIPAAVQKPEVTDVPVTGDEAEENHEKSNAENTVKTSPLPDLTVKTNAEVKSEQPDSWPLLPIMILGIALAVVCIIGIIVIFIFKKKRTNETTIEETGEVSKTPETEKKVLHEERDDTVISHRKRTAGKDESSPTEGLWPNESQPRYYLLLKCLDVPAVTHKVPIEDSVRIGRAETSDIVLNDKEVSRTHCEILLRGGLLYVKDCNSSNHTIYENAIVYGEVPVVSGGKLEIGAHVYCVELVKEP